LIPNTHAAEYPVLTNTAIIRESGNLAQSTEVNAPRQIFLVSSGIRSFDTSADSQHLLMITRIENSATVAFAVAPTGQRSCPRVDARRRPARNTSLCYHYMLR
jgi:hypothetical protein